MSSLLGGGTLRGHHQCKRQEVFTGCRQGGVLLALLFSSVVMGPASEGAFGTQTCTYGLFPAKHGVE